MATRSSVATLSPHVYAVADQAWRMIVSEKKDQSSAVSVVGRWKDTELLRHLRVRPSWVGCSRLPSIHWARLHLQHNQRRAKVCRHSPLQHYSHSLSTSLCAHSHSCCFIICASICTRLHTRRTSDLRALLSHRCRSGMIGFVGGDAIAVAAEAHRDRRVVLPPREGSRHSRAVARARRWRAF